MQSPRGSISIFKDLFNNDQPAVHLSGDKTLIRKQKNECLIDYYYFTGRKEVLINNRPAKLGYNDLLNITAATFFLSPFTVHDIIQANGDLVTLVKQQWKDEPMDKLQKHFQQKWPQFVW